VGEKILEINTFTPGGLNNVSELQGVNFCDAVVAALEDKMVIRDGYGRQMGNRELATL
jgi:glutathione synthase